MIKKLIAIALTAVLAPVAASAVSVGDSIVRAETLDPGEKIELDFVIDEDLFIPEFAFTGIGVGDDAGIDLGNVTFGLMAPPTQKFENIEVVMNVATGSAVIPGAYFKAGDMFSIYVEDGINNPVLIGIGFSATPIPVPAAGLMLLTALVGGGLVLRKRAAA